jgi:hypothetical protein
MLTEKRTMNIPGYTGHTQEQLEYDTGIRENAGRSQIPGK